eukprot:4008798-Amphidinium_carterae.1
MGQKHRVRRMNSALLDRVVDVDCCQILTPVVIGDSTHSDTANASSLTQNCERPEVVEPPNPQ